ncbi:MAG TPA: NAD(P)H-dependent glycerol-3-phosphate dehydrogenase [Steroidobacteraceae bacterium]|nr:NAD(P)H-dependent glycerol-3-phosphate dehydrogenase [Steroidobacteraceae bacterium]
MPPPKDAGVDAGSRSAMAVIGAGSWGTALAVHLARTIGRAVLWGLAPPEMTDLARDRVNQRYLPEAPFPASLEIVTTLEAAVRGADELLVAVPSHAFRACLDQVAPLLRPGMRVAWATKGFELETGKLPHQVATEVLGMAVPTAVLSGPTFAREVGLGLPTAMTVASRDRDYAMELAQRLSGAHFRAYASTDMIGVEVGGATKNVLAIGAGISDGLGFGANTRVALITRGLAEMMRLGVALGANKDTFMGLTGLGDLVLTCTDNQSRNRRFGLALAAGKSSEEAQREIGQVVEGVLAARAVTSVARTYRVEMPIAEQICRIIYEGAPPREAVAALMGRAIKAETQ